MSKSGRGRSGENDWWRRWPDRREQELAAFARAGATVLKEYATNGMLILEVAWPDGDQTVRLNVGFSPLHPFARPCVSAPELSLTRHQNPFTKSLCLLVQGAGQWWSAQMVADLIASQLPKAREAVEARESGRLELAAELEEQTPDPKSAYYMNEAEAHSVLFFGADQPIPDTDFGLARFALQRRPFGPESFEGVLQKVEPIGRPWHAAPFDLPRPLAGREPVTGRWVRLEPPRTTDPKALLAAAEAELTRLAALNPVAQKQLRAADEAAVSITGIVFKEEVAYGPERVGEGWLFLVARREPNRPAKRKVTLVRAQRIAADLLSRSPTATQLAKKRVLLVGCGAIGSFVAVELARAGLGRLELMDFDVVEPGTTVRWVLGRQAWGVQKTVALRDFLYRNYPGTEVLGNPTFVGAATSDRAVADKAGGYPLDHLLDAISEADVVVDASASTECHEALGFYCRERGKPYVIGWATEGAVGGLVARFQPGAGLCPVCLTEHLSSVPAWKPPEDAAGTIHPIGCNQPTFVGASVDLQEVSLQIVRTVAATLVPEAARMADWNIAVLSLVDGQGRRVLPRWEAVDLPVHAGCGCRPAATAA